MTRSDIDAAINRIAAGQHGAFSMDQLAAAGGDDRMAARRVRVGRWARSAERVFTVAGYPTSFEQRLWIASLAVKRAVISHESAARVRALATFGGSDEVVILVPHGTHRTEVARCHQTRRDFDSLGAPAANLPGLLVATVAETISQVATIPDMSRGRLKLVIEDAIVRRLVSFEAVVEAWTDARRRGLPVANLGAVLSSLGPTADIPTSELNRRLHNILARVGGPPARFEAPFPGRELPGSVVDGVLEPERIITEGDGRSWHSRERDFARDRERDRAAARSGYVTVRYTYRECDDVAGVAAELTALRVQRRLDLGLPPLDLAA